MTTTPQIYFKPVLNSFNFNYRMLGGNHPSLFIESVLNSLKMHFQNLP